MKLTCNQFEILISFYLENELSPCLKKQFEEHLQLCKSCSEKMEVIKTIFDDMKNVTIGSKAESSSEDYYITNVHENIFKTNLSAYIDNELTNDENIKIKKYTITNKKARKDLEDSYNIRRLMQNSYKKTKADAKQDYTKTILKKLELEHEIQSEFQPAIKLLVVFTLIVLIVTTVVLVSLNQY